MEFSAHPSNPLQFLNAILGHLKYFLKPSLSVGEDGAGAGDSAPALVITPQYRQVSPGDTVRLRCEAEGRPQPSVTWRRADGARMRSGVVVLGNTLDIASVSPRDEGGYICQASNRAGMRETEAVLKVSGGISVRVTPEDVIIRSGDTISLTCAAQPSDRVSVTWSKINGRLSSSAFQENGLLRIDNADTTDSGVYLCTVVSRGDQETSRARVTVTDGADRGHEPPVVSISPEWRTIGQGESVRLVCQVSGATLVRWSKVGGDMDSDNIIVTDTELSITSARVEDRGMYLCTAENVAGVSRASTILEVEPREAPTVEIFPDSSQTISTGGSVLFQCRAKTGIPSPTISWRRQDGRPMSSNVEKLSGGVIRMTQVTGEEVIREG